MPQALINTIMPDGSRHFFSLHINGKPRRLLWQIMCLPALPTGYLADPISGECWLDFRWRGQSFSIHNPYGADEYWFFVANSRCPENGLRQLADYFAQQNPSSPSVQKKE
ncbi:hypothetical protein [Kingella oralis]|jgi:hypothetical protein|uniref:hypothetical protein n=1 Tax=Kingella oralis TaxID=505 RepID=UPI003C6FFA2B